MAKEPTNPAVERAMAAVQAGRARAEADPTRPVCHLRPPANWMNDPNGPIFHNGWYHVFYQHNPFGDSWGQMQWGHARSRDLVHWEHLPIAIWPSSDAGEDQCWSGCAVINADGEPMVFYTSIGPGRKAADSADQWAAVGDDDLVTWRKHPANPILDEDLHGATKVYDWRDPFAFRHEGRTYLVLGGNLNQGKGGQGVVNLYRACDEKLARWEYLGVLLRHPSPKVTNIECPNLVRLGDRWVLLVSPHGPVEYFVGACDPDAGRFEVAAHGIVDPGNFYASNCFCDGQGRRILLGWVTGFDGWVPGFRAGRGWNGCMTFPRAISVGPDGHLWQEPVDELRALRGHHAAVSGVRVSNGSRRIEGVRGDVLEIAAEIRPGDAARCGLKLRCAEDGTGGIGVAYDGRALTVEGSSAPVLVSGHALKLRVFMDRSVVEVFAGGRSITRVVYPGQNDLAVEAFADGGEATVVSLDAWELKPIW